MQKLSVLVNSIATPLQIGLYQQDILIKTITKEGKTSDILPDIFKQFDFEINKLIYVNSPGSYMAIKVAYIYLKTLSIIKDIPFFAISGFELNNNSPIKALGKKYFFNQNGNIVCKALEQTDIYPFKLPKNLTTLSLCQDTLPKYFLPVC